jgi:predicted nucleotidyltransferase
MINPALNLSHGKVADFCRQHRIKTLSLFGSATRDDFRPDSDVDVFVEFADDARVSLFDMARMERELSVLFDNRAVDIVTTSVLRNPYRRQAILRDLERVYVA